MNVELVTVEDLEKFRIQLLRDLEAILNKNKTKKWIKTHEVLKLLDISDVTLQTLRAKGVIPYKKLGGICYYNSEELDAAMKNL